MRDDGYVHSVDCGDHFMGENMAELSSCTV